MLFYSQKHWVVDNPVNKDDEYASYSQLSPHSSIIRATSDSRRSDKASQFQHPLYQFTVFIDPLILITQTTAAHTDETTRLAFIQPTLAY